jgi:hypothetical protein
VSDDRLHRTSSPHRVRRGFSRDLLFSFSTRERIQHTRIARGRTAGLHGYPVLLSLLVVSLHPPREAVFGHPIRFATVKAQQVRLIDWGLICSQQRGPGCLVQTPSRVSLREYQLTRSSERLFDLCRSAVVRNKVPSFGSVTVIYTECTMA